MRLSGVGLNSLLTVSQRNSVWIVVERRGEARGMRKEEGISFFDDGWEGSEVFLNENF